MQVLAVRVLGDLDVQGVELSVLSSRKARTMLWLLAIARGQPVTAERLASALWGDEQPAKPADQVAVLASRLRRVLGRDRVPRNDAGYRVHYDWLDADELAGLVTEIESRSRTGNLPGAAAAANVALSLVRGELAAPVDPWSEGLVAELDRLVARARRAAAAALLGAGQWIDAADVAAAATARDPYDEDALRVLMRAQVATGRMGSALAAYAQMQERLATDLGADPSPETDELHAEILRGTVAPAVPATSAERRLVGRDWSLDRLDAAAARARTGRVEVVAVTGEAGIGKTSVLRAWADRRRRMGDLVLFTSCGALDRAVPLNALLDALRTRLHAGGPDRTVAVLADDAELLGPLLGLGDSGSVPIALADGVVGPFLLFAALLRTLRRLAGHAPLVLVIDDAHRAGPIQAAWLSFARERGTALTVVAGSRIGEGEPLPVTDTIELGPLDRPAVVALVGEPRAAALLARSGGNPLFLSELAAADPAGPLPASLVDAVVQRCDDLGPEAAALLRAAAVIGSRLDLDVLGAVLHRPVIDLLTEAEVALARGLLVDDDGGLWFRHDLVRAALAGSASAGRIALLHREVSRVLQRRADADPMEVAEHARRGGDLAVAARFLRTAAARAAQRFDHATAEGLLDDALQLDATSDGWLERARVRTLRGRYAAAYEDVERAGAAGAAALEVGAWASYFDRRFAQAIRFAADGELAAADPETRGRCLGVGARTLHASGDLHAAERMLDAAIPLLTGPDRVSASAWLGVVRAHQSRIPEALQLLGPAARAQIGAEHTSATLHSVLFSGHVHAARGQPALALRSFERYTEEVRRRHVPRFSGRGLNFAAWVLRNVGEVARGVDDHLAALEIGPDDGTYELRVAALEDLAEAALTEGDVSSAAARLDEAQALLTGDLVFGWRLEMKLSLLRARVALASGDAAAAAETAAGLAGWATDAGVPRYVGVARLVEHRARVRLGERVDLDAVESDLDLVERTMGLESWWWTGDTGAALAVPRWVSRAGDALARLADQAGEHADALRSAAAARFSSWESRPAASR